MTPEQEPYCEICGEHHKSPMTQLQQIADEAAWEFERISADGRIANHSQLRAIILRALERAKDEELL